MILFFKRIDVTRYDLSNINLCQGNLILFGWNFIFFGPTKLIWCSVLYDLIPWRGYSYRKMCNCVAVEVWHKWILFYGVTYRLHICGFTWMISGLKLITMWEGLLWEWVGWLRSYVLEKSQLLSLKNLEVSYILLWYQCASGVNAIF